MNEIRRAHWYRSVNESNRTTDLASVYWCCSVAGVDVPGNTLLYPIQRQWTPLVHLFVCYFYLIRVRAPRRSELGCLHIGHGHDISGVVADRCTLLLVSLLMYDNKRCYGIYTGIMDDRHLFIQDITHYLIPITSQLTQHDNHRTTIHHPSCSYLNPCAFRNRVLALHALSSSLQYCLP